MGRYSTCVVSLRHSNFVLGIIIIPSFVLTQNAGSAIITCDPLNAQGTSVLCIPAASNVPSDCNQPSIPGTIANYACRNSRGEILRGSLNCTEEGYWISSLRAGNNSLCNLEAAIVNIQNPDVAVALGPPGFTTPVPNTNLLQLDFGFLTDYQKTALQLHNTFRRNHGVPFVSMAPLMNEAAQDLTDLIASGKLSEVDASHKLSLLNVTLNIEMNWYLQQPAAPNKVEAVSNAVQSWYAAGFAEYDFNNVRNNLNKGNVLSFSRVIWKTTKYIGVGVTNFNDITFVTVIYTPGRHIGSPDPIQEFQNNVLPVRVG